MVRLTAPSDGELVLDPAAGKGTILSLAVADGAHGFGIELNPSTVSLATFYIDLFHHDVEITTGDFFELEARSDQLPDSIDHIIVDPPFNAYIERDDIPFSNAHGRIYSQDAFLAHGLSLLNDEGTITIAVPFGFLYNRRSEWIRRTILEEFQLDSVIQIVDNPIYSHTSIDTALITVSNQPPSSDHVVNYEIIESPDIPPDIPGDALADAVTTIKDGSSASIRQSELDDSLNFRRLTAQKGDS